MRAEAWEKNYFITLIRLAAGNPVYLYFKISKLKYLPPTVKLIFLLYKCWNTRYIIYNKDTINHFNVLFLITSLKLS